MIRGSKPDPVPWNAFDVVVGVVTLALLGLLLILVLGLAVSEDRELGRESGVRLALAGGISGAIMLLISWLIGPARYGAPLSSLGLKLPVPQGPAQLLLPVLVLIASLTFTGIYTLVVSALGWDVPRTLPEGLDGEGPMVIGLLAVIVVLLVPLAEEVFFRGFMLSGLAGSLGFVGAAIVSSLVFALFHIDPKIMLPIFVTGLLFAWLYNRTGSVWGCSAAHAMQNALALAVTVGN